MSRVQELKRQLSFALQQLDWPEALSILQTLVGQEESQPAYFNQIGDLQLKLGKKDEAIESFKRGVQSYSELGMFPNGIALCKKILRLDSENSDAIWMIGELKTRQGFLAEGAEMILQALRLFSEDPKVEKLTLVELLRKAEQFQGGNQEVLELVARCYAQMGDGIQARAVTLRLADIEEREGNAENAACLRQLAQKYVPDQPLPADSLETPLPETTGPMPGPAEPAPVPVGPALEPAISATGLAGGAGSEPASPPPLGASDIPLLDDVDLPEIEILSPGTPASLPSLSGDGPEAKRPAENTAASELEIPALEIQPTSPAPPASSPSTNTDPEQLVESSPALELQDPFEAIEPADGSSSDQICAVGRGESVDDVDEVLREFCSQLREQDQNVSPAESYELGVSFMEMELYEEARSEFERVVEDPQLGYSAKALLARCLFFLERPGDVISLLEPILDAEGRLSENALDLYYLLGRAYESLGKQELALGSFGKVYQLNDGYHDIHARLEKLTRPE